MPENTALPARRRRRVPAALVALATALAGVVLPVATPTAVAATPDRIEVTTTADTVDAGDGVTSLREAIGAASSSGGETAVVLAAGAGYSLTRCDGIGDRDSGDLDITPVLIEFATMSVIVEGNGSTIIGTCDGERLLEIGTVASVELRDVGLLAGNGRDRGGALLASGFGTLVLDRVTVSDTLTTSGTCTARCTAQAAVHVIGGALFELRDSTIAGSRTDMSMCTATCVAIGGLLSRADSTIVTRTAISDNSGRLTATCTSGCNAVGGALLEGLASTVDASSFTDNVGEVPYCDFCRSSGAVALVAVQGASFHNATVAENAAYGIDRVAGVDRLIGDLTLVSSTVVGNTAHPPANFPDGQSGPSNVQSTGRGPITFVGTVVGSDEGSSGCNVTRATVAASHSFDSGTLCGFGADRGNISNGGDPELAALSGRLPRRAPLPGSPVADAIPVAACPTPRDQVGVPRPQAAACDVGAVEVLAGVSQFVALPPVRLFDTRPDEAAAGPKGFVTAGAAIDVQVVGVAGVPRGDIAAVVVNLTATAAAAPGFVTAWPAGGQRPVASSINLTEAGQTRSNLVTVPLGADGRISLFASGGAHLLGDVAGYYLTTTTATASGRLVPQTPTRLFDTRPAEPAAGPKGYVDAGGTVTVPVTGRSGVPTTGVAAVVLNVTATEAGAAGFVTAWPAGRPRPLASIVNLNAAGDTASNLVMLPVGADGRIELSVSGGAHLLADVTGYVTSVDAPESTSGLFVPLAPVRAFDTRAAEAAPGPKGLVGAGATLRTVIGGAVGVPADAGAVVLNVAATEVDAPGFVTTYPAGPEQPLASTLNVGRGDVRSNAVIVPVGRAGEVLHYSLSAAHLIADVSGWFLR